MPKIPPGTPYPPHFDEYFKQLGMFTVEFSKTENYLFICLIATSDVTIPIGKAIFSGVRGKEAMSFMRRVFLTKKLPKNIQSLMENCFEQINVINDIRNYLMHHNVDFKEENLRVTNSIRSLFKEQEKSYAVSPRIINDMGQDLSAINSTLEYCAKFLLRQPPEEVPLSLKKVEERLWLYKPSTQQVSQRVQSQSAPKNKRKNLSFHE